MIKIIKDILWFIKEYSRFTGTSKMYVILHEKKKIYHFAKELHKWRKLTPQQREAWYLSGEGRTFEI